MDKIYSEMSDENDFTEGRKKRRISSILKAPQSPVRDLGSGNELTQDCNVEKRQRNSRRVSFAATISIFPSDPPTTEVSDHTGTATAKDQDTLNQNAELEADLCDITGMNTLLHAPIRIPLQQLEDNVNTRQERSKMDRTLLFSDENEMDMTSGHTIIINHATEICQDTERPKRIALKASSSALELKQEVTQMNDLSFISCPTKANESCLSQQKTNTENTTKIKFDDFLKSLKSTKLFPSPIASEKTVCPSKENVYTYLEGGNGKNTDIGRPANRQNYANINEGGVNIKIASSDASVSCYQGTNPFSMPFGSVTSMPVLHGNTNRKSGVLNNAACLNSADKTSIFGFGEDMEITKPTHLIANPINAAGFQGMPSQEMGIGKKDRTLLDKTVFFSLGEDNEMEFTKSCTVAAKYAIQQCERTSQVLSLQPLDKTVYHTKMDETKAITTIIDQPVKAAGVQAMQKQSELGSTNVTEPACDKTLVFPQSKDNEMEFTKSLTMVVEGASLAESQIPAGSTNMSAFSSNMAISKSTAFPEGKMIVYMHNDDMEVTKPISHIMNTSQEDTGFKPLQLKKKEMDNVIQSSSAKAETMCCLDEDNEMMFTRSHTLSVNSDVIIPWAKVATQVLSSAPVDKNSIFTHSSDATITKSTTFVPANKTIMCNNSIEITNPISSTFLNRCFKSLPQQEMSNTRILGSVTDNTVLAPHDNEMEMTKCHTVTVNVDNISQSENSPHIQFHQDNMNIAGTKNPKGNLPWNVMKLEMDAGWEPSSDQIATLSTAGTEMVKRQTMPFDSRTSLYSQPASQDGREVTILPPSAVVNGSLQAPEKQEMLTKNLKQNLGGVPFPTCRGTLENIEATRYQAVITYDPNCPCDAEKQRPKSSTRSEEKAFGFLGGENMEVNGVKIQRFHSQTKSSSEFPNVSFGGKHDAQIDNDISQKCNSPASVTLPIALEIVPEQQNFLKIQEKRLESCTFKANFAKESTLNDGYCEKNDLMFPVKMCAPYTKLHEETAVESNTERMCISTAECKSLKDDPRQVGSFAGETEAFPIDKISKKFDTVLCDWSSTAKDNNLDPPPINNVTSEEKPILLSKLSDVVSDCSKLNDNGKKSELFLPSQDIEKELPQMAVKPADHLELREDVKNVSNIPIASNEWTNNDFTDVAPLSVPLNALWNDSCKMKKSALGIFPPKLPNKRKPTIPNVEYIGARSEEKVETQGSKITQFLRRSLDKVTSNLSPSHYIDEELLPACVGEMDFDESLGCEVPEKLMKEKELADTEGCLHEVFKTSNMKKRAWNQDDEKLQQEKKLKTDEGWNDAVELEQPLSGTMLAHETQEGKNVTDLLATDMEMKQSSNSSSLDSIKADTDFSIQQNNEMEIPLLTNIICEQNLKEKLQDGTITVGEFFTLLHVDAIHHYQSLLSPKHPVNTALTPEDEFLNEYVYCPKFQIYKEDCQALYKIIEELKYEEYQHKPLVNVNKSLWGVMRTCSDEELERFREGLRKMKSVFLKKSKVLAHKGKATLYGKLVQNGQLQWEKLQSRLAKVEELIKEMDSCILALETETSALEESEPDVNDAMAEYKSKIRDTERELENYKAKEEALQREQSNIRDKKKQRASEISHLKEQANRCQELTKKYNFSEWAIKEWNDHQAVLTFLYDSVKLTLSFGCPVDGAVFSNRSCINIVGVNLESLLNEAKALPSSKLVHRLIFQFINSQSSLQEKCSTVHHLSQVLHDISLVVSRCELLGEEIEYLKRWGGKFNLLKTDVNDTKVKLLFSSSVAFAKFEVELSLSASYPASPIAFTIRKCIGNLNQEEISVVLSSVPVGPNYLKRMVNQIHHNLLQGPSIQR
ncbi:kinetochore scaffold 1 [Zootoca vivipara]|uniref:kinetochore scaffold 1 n=1 Tax=Zootoca vivipara TaxID=8524 RepID=UPI00159119E2|nr:kinetochore scaffold 1 [Zootoca vivipara]